MVPENFPPYKSFDILQRINIAETSYIALAALQGPTWRGGLMHFSEYVIHVSLYISVQPLGWLFAIARKMVRYHVSLPYVTFISQIQQNTQRGMRYGVRIKNVGQHIQAHNDQGSIHPIVSTPCGLTSPELARNLLILWVSSPVSAI